MVSQNIVVADSDASPLEVAEGIRPGNLAAAWNCSCCNYCLVEKDKQAYFVVHGGTRILDTGCSLMVEVACRKENSVVDCIQNREHWWEGIGMTEGLEKTGCARHMTLAVHYIVHLKDQDMLRYAGCSEDPRRMYCVESNFVGWEVPVVHIEWVDCFDRMTGRHRSFADVRIQNTDFVDPGDGNLRSWVHNGWKKLGKMADSLPVELARYIHYPKIHVRWRCIQSCYCDSVSRSKASL